MPFPGVRSESGVQRLKSCHAGSAPRDSVSCGSTAFSPAQNCCHRGLYGGPDALAKLLLSFPANFPLPVVIAQHMPPIFTTLLAKRLESKCALRVREGQPGDSLGPSCVWIAPGDYHMVVQEEEHHMRLGTHQGPRENFCRPSVDVLFRSVAAVYGANSLGVILTGMGQDGLKGCEALCAAGASVIVQDEASSVVWGMPGFVARAGLAEKILPLDQICGEIMRRVADQPSLQLTH
jgi:two-component system, chemotaxis family, protein-glutamate methylesterase/glutaminase